MLNRPGGFRDPGEPEEYCRGFQVFDKELTGFIGVGQFRYILTNLGEKMSDDEVDELLKAVDTSSGEINYVGMFIPDFPSLCAARTNTFSQTLSRPSSQTKHLSHLYTHPFSFSKQNTILGALARDMKHGRRFFSFTLFNSGTRMNYIAITFGRQYRVLYSGNYTSTAFLKTCLWFLPSLFRNAA